jgi:hypothetical protein
MTHILPDLSAPRCMRPLVCLRESARAFTPVVYATAQTDGGRPQILTFIALDHGV